MTQNRQPIFPPDHPVNSAQLDRFDIRINRDSYPEVEQLISTTKLTAALPSTEGDKGYVLSRGTEVTVINDQQLSIGGLELWTNIYRLPAYAHQALIRQSASTTYPGLHDLLTLMRGNPNRGEVAQAIKAAVREARQPGSQILQARVLQVDGTWHPEFTALKQSGNDYQVSLVFTTRPIGLPARGRQAIGLDVGINPLSVAYHTDGTVQSFHLPKLVLPDREVLSTDEQRLLDQLIYVNGREASEQVLNHILTHAERVYAEKIRLKDMKARNVELARASAVHDHHFAWLPQLCYRAGIRLQRVPSGGTSIHCPRCGHDTPDNRTKDRFSCMKCLFTENDHVVAAANVLYRGWNADPEARRRHPWPTPPRGTGT